MPSLNMEQKTGLNRSGFFTTTLKQFIYKKVDWVALLILDPPHVISTTIPNRLVCQDRNLCLGEPAYLNS